MACECPLEAGAVPAESAYSRTLDEASLRTNVLEKAGEAVRILHVADVRQAKADGVSAAVLTLARSEAAMGHAVALLSRRAATSDMTEAISADNITVLPAVSRSPISIKKVIEEWSPDVAHLGYLFSPDSSVAARQLKRLTIPYVVSPHGALHPGELRRSQWKRFKKAVYLRLLDARMLRNAKAIRCVSDAEEAVIRSFLPDARTVVIPNGVTWPYATEHPGPPTGSVRLGYIGRLDPNHKGLDLLSELAKHLTAKGFRVSLEIAGRWQQRFAAELLELMLAHTELPGAPTISFHGQILDEARVGFFSEVDIYVQYSRWELFGMSIVEAMLAGVPVAISENCDLAAEAGRAGAAIVLSSDPACAASQLADLWKRPHVRMAMVKRARRWASRQFDPHEIARRTTSLYAEVLAGPPQPAQME